MNVQEFVTETLKQIVEGVRAAQAQTGDCSVNPQLVIEDHASGWHSVNERPELIPQLNLTDVDFDIAVTVSEGIEGGAKGGITIARLVNFEAGGSKSSAAVTVSRVAFKVPLNLPASK